MQILNPFHQQVEAHMHLGLAEFPRGRLLQEFGHVAPTDEALSQIAKNCPRIIEIGAGKGYWADQLAQRGVDIVAFDIKPEGRKFYPVAQGDHRQIAQFPDRALLLCWPDHDNPMSEDCLRQFIAVGGSNVIYVGEPGNGCTGTAEFRELLYRHFTETSSVVVTHPYPEVTSSIWSRIA